jgi:hypothetical protein
MYCALEAYVTNNGTTIPSPVDIDQWRSNPPYQLNGCVRVSRVYADSARMYAADARMSESVCGRIPPDGQESAALLKHAEAAAVIASCSTSACSAASSSATTSAAS